MPRSMEVDTSNRWWNFSSFTKTILFPIFLPYFIYQLIEYYRTRRYWNSLPGKVVLITGASSGLGEQMAHIFYNAGCKLILCSRNTAELERVKFDLMRGCTRDVVYPPVVFPLNLTDLQTMAVRVEKILEIYGYIDILINNAGISVRGSIVECIDDVDIRLMMVNYFGVVKLTRLFLPSMISRGDGHVVCIGSVQGKFAIPFRAAYAASKHALQAFCDSLRAEVHEHNVRVTLISPGYIQTNLSRNALSATGDVYGKMDKNTATGYTSEYVATRVLKAILRRKNDEVVAGFVPKAAIWLRFLCPSLYFYIMARKAKKESQTVANKQD